MRKLIYTFALVVLIGMTTPAVAQYRSAVPVQEAPVKVYEDGFSFNKLFSPEHFQLRHSYEMSYSSFGGQGISMGTYTSSLMWHFNSKLAARADVAFSHSPFGTGNFQQAFGGQDLSRIYLRNAELIYRPTENSALHLSFRQNPYGGYMNPYGYGYGMYDRYGYGSYYGYSPFGRGASFSASYGAGNRDPFWNPRLR